MSDYISEKLWFLFNLLGVKDTTWMNEPLLSLDSHPDFVKFNAFVSKFRVVNDLAKRGIQLLSDYIDQCHDEGQRQALLQVVELHRRGFPDLNNDHTDDS